MTSSTSVHTELRAHAVPSTARKGRQKRSCWRLTNLARMSQQIPLTEEERAAVDDGVEAMEKLLKQLQRIRPHPTILTLGRWVSALSLWETLAGSSPDVTEKLDTSTNST